MHEAGRSHDRSGGRMGNFEPVISRTGALNSRFRPIRERRIRYRPSRRSPSRQPSPIEVVDVQVDFTGLVRRPHRPS